jgi:hypothetical protein
MGRGHSAGGRERRLVLALDRHLDELAHPIPQPDFGRINQSSRRVPLSRLPTARLTTSCYWWSWRSLHRHTNAGIVLVSARRLRPPNSHHGPDGRQRGIVIMCHERIMDIAMPQPLGQRPHLDLKTGTLGQETDSIRT